MQRDIQVAGKYSFTTFEEYVVERWAWTTQHVGRLIKWYETAKQIEHKCSVLPSRGTYITELLKIQDDGDRAIVWQNVLDHDETITFHVQP